MLWFLVTMFINSMYCRGVRLFDMADIELDKEILYKAVKDGVREALANDVCQQQLEQGYAWMYEAVKEGTRLAMRDGE